jgi:hypothetical protein
MFTVYTVERLIIIQVFELLIGLPYHRKIRQPIRQYCQKGYRIYSSNAQNGKICIYQVLQFTIQV